MAFYETVFIVRQDVSSAEVDKITEELSSVVTSNNSKVIKTEYWGLRNLAYDINNNKKGHYVLLGLEATTEALKELERKMKYSEDLIRYTTIRVEEISSDASPILKGKQDNFEDTIDVTIA